MNNPSLSSESNISDKIWSVYSDICNSYAVGKNRDVVLDGGHFVESVLRLIQYELTGLYTDYGKSLPAFDDKLLKFFESQPGHDSYRLLIPRILKPIYDMRNKRNIGHTSKELDPNSIDSTFVLYSVKWVISELIRVNKNISIEDASTLIPNVIVKQLPVIWENGDYLRVLDTSLNVKDKILVLLYYKEKLDYSEVLNIIEYSNSTYFRKYVKELHRDRLIEYDVKNKVLFITSKGLSYVDRELSNHLRTS